MEPKEFGDYELVKKLAAGGMGEVFLARQVRGAGFDRYLAIKRILPDLSGDEEFVRMFLDEARLAAKLTHPNVVEIHDLGICGDQYYIAMEFLEGRDLRRIMSRLSHLHRALPGAHAIQVIYNAAEGLDYAHELTDPSGMHRDVIHRDVSPQNIFVTFDGTVKVLDFGIAKAGSRTVRTRTGGLKGKYPYMSPEQVRGETIDRRSDIFSLGVILWEVTVGRRLFRRDNDLLTLNAVLKCEVPRPGSLMDRYPSELEQVVMRALEKDPAGRYPTCRAMQEDLESFMTEYGLVLSPQKLGKSVRRLFADEPATVKDILDSLKAQPKSKSLLREDSDSSGSRSAARIRSSAPDETSETSGPSTPSGGRVASSQSIPGLGQVPVGFDGGDGSGGSEPSPSSGAGALVNVLWTAEEESASGGKAALAVNELPRVDAARATGEADDEAAAIDEAIAIDAAMGVDVDIDVDAEISKASEPAAPVAAKQTDPWVTPSGVLDVERLKDEAVALGALPSVDSADLLTEPRPPRGPSRPDEPGVAPVGAVDTDWLATAETAVRILPEAEVSRRDPSEPRPLRPPAAAALPFLDGLPEEDTVTTSPEAGRAAAPAPPARRRIPPLVLLFSAAGFAILVVTLVAVILAPDGTDQPPGAGVGAGGAAGGGAAVGPGTKVPEPVPPTREDAGASGPSPPVSDASARPGDGGRAAADGGPGPEVADGAVEPASPGGVQVTLSTQPSGLTLFVRGQLVGNSPAKTTLPAGTHPVRVRSRSAGIDFVTEIEVPPGAQYRETISVPQGSLAFRVRPWATVFVDGRRLGMTPMPPVSLYIGSHRVRLENDSLGKTVTRVAKVRPNQRTTIDVDLSAAP